MPQEETSSTSNVVQAAEEAQHEVNRVTRNSSVRELMDLGKELRSVDGDVHKFVRDQQEYERQERRLHWAGVVSVRLCAIAEKEGKSAFQCPGFNVSTASQLAVSFGG